MTWLFTLVAGWGVPAKAVKLVSWAMIAAIIAALLVVGKCSYDRRLIANHDLEVDASAAKADRKADEKLNDRKLSDTQREAQEADQLQKAMDHVSKTTNSNDDVARRLAFHRCLRLQQAARANGLEPPACV